MGRGFRTLVEDVGVNIVGGCCGTGPAHVRAAVEAVRVAQLDYEQAVGVERLDMERLGG